jgi:hypothetical protein
MHHLAFAETPAADLRVLVAPAAGAFRPLTRGAGPLPAGGLLGHVTGSEGRAEVASPSDAVLDGLLAVAGEIVDRGQVLAWGRRCALEALS